jgi:Domain of unknown function (DUF4386)
MKERIAEASPRLTARIAGFFYLLIFVAAGFAEFFVRGRLVVYGDAAATAANILAHQSLYRLGGAAQLFTLTCDIAVALLFYELLKPVSRSLSLFAAVFRLVFVAMMAANSLNYLAPLVLLKGAHFLTAFTPDQLQGLALVSLQSYATGYEMALVFFGVHCLLIGCLIFRSAFLPRILGLLMAFAGFGWLTFLWPPLAHHLSPYVLLPGLFGEGSLTVWLLVIGVNAQRWEEQASAAGQRRS